MASTRNQQVLAEHQARFEQQVGGGKEFVKLLREIDAQAYRFEQDRLDRHRWWIYL